MRRAVGYLGFKNARFGKIDAHIATCAFARQVLKRAVKIAELHGFDVVHGIVDSLWLRKDHARNDEFEKITQVIGGELDLPISFEGRYRWIVFLNSRVDPRVPVLNRYYGLFEDGTIKTRGIDMRRHDVPTVVKKCQENILKLMAEANHAREFERLIPSALSIAKYYAKRLRKLEVPIEDLVIRKQLSKDLDEYQKLLPQAIVGEHLRRKGVNVHAGQTVSYIIVNNKSAIASNRALPAQFVGRNSSYDAECYVKLLATSLANLFLPLGLEQGKIESYLH